MKHLTTTVLILGLIAALYIATKAIVSPETVLSNLGISIIDANGRNEIRGQYGGFFSAIALMLVFALMNTLSRTLALQVLLITIGGVLFGRLLTIAIEGVTVVEHYSPILKAFIVFDLVMFVLLIICLKAQRENR